MNRVQEKRHNHRHERTEPAATEQDTHAPVADDLKHDLDEVLDEIDSVLEQNAEEFVTAYVQKGGE
jgi:ubiquitin-like protein Pup